MLIVSKSVLCVVAMLATVIVVHQSADGAEPVATSPSQRSSMIELWYISPGSVPEKPDVAVLSDGSVWTINGIQTQLSQDQLKQLLNDLLATDKLMQISSAELATEIKAESARYALSCRIPGADDTMIRIRTQNETYEIRCHAAGLLVNRFPQVKCLQCFASAQRRLENVRAVTEIGGEEAAKKLAFVARTQLETEHGVALPITSADLSMVRELPDGSRYCQFLVSNSQRAEESHIVSVIQSPGTSPRVSLQNTESVVQ